MTNTTIVKADYTQEDLVEFNRRLALPEDGAVMAQRFMMKKCNDDKETMLKFCKEAEALAEQALEAPVEPSEETSVEVDTPVAEETTEA